MSFIKGNLEVLRLFEENKKSGKLSHAYIIEGARGSGRLTLARAISAILICENTPACFECSACKKILRGEHQDVRELITTENASVLSINEVREIIKDSYIKPAESDKRIFIIENAQQMDTYSQNALLQTFEEPPKNVFFFLLTTNRNLLLPTLKSRALTLKTEKFSDEEVEKELKRRFKNDTEFIPDAVILADGAIGAGVEFLENEDKKKSYRVVSEYFRVLDESGKFSELVALTAPNPLAKLSREFAFSLLTLFITAIRDILVYSECRQEKVLFFSDKALLHSLSEKLDKKTLLEAFDTVSETLHDIKKNNVYIALQHLNSVFSRDF